MMYKLTENLKQSNVVCYYFVTVEPSSLSSLVAGALVFREKEKHDHKSIWTLLNSEQLGVWSIFGLFKVQWLL